MRDLDGLPGDDGCRDRPILEPIAELEQAGEQVVLASDFLGLLCLLLDSIVLRSEGFVLGSQGVDFADGGGDGADAMADPIERTLDRTEGEAQAALQLDHQRVGRRSHHHEAQDEHGEVGDGAATRGPVGEDGAHRWTGWTAPFGDIEVSAAAGCTSRSRGRAPWNPSPGARRRFPEPRR